MVLDGRSVAQKVLGEVKAGVERLRAETGASPMLAVVLVGDFAPSKIYVANKKKATDSVGIATRDYVYPEGLTQHELVSLLGSLRRPRRARDPPPAPARPGLRRGRGDRGDRAREGRGWPPPDEPRPAPHRRADGRAVHPRRVPGDPRPLRREARGHGGRGRRPLAPR